MTLYVVCTRDEYWCDTYTHVYEDKDVAERECKRLNEIYGGFAVIRWGA